jgi:hypothetical protein
MQAVHRTQNRGPGADIHPIEIDMGTFVHRDHHRGHRSSVVLVSPAVFVSLWGASCKLMWTPGDSSLHYEIYDIK